MTRQGRTRHPLSSEDRALWEEIKRLIKPLRTQPMESVADQMIAQPLAASKKKSKPQQQSAAPAVKALPPLAPLERRMRQRITRGRAEIDDRLDLHGHTLERAHSRLQAFLASAQARGASLILVITGKGSGRTGDLTNGERGILRRQVPMWLALPEMRAFVVGFEQAAPAHGGTGAFYVRIRKKK